MYVALPIISGSRNVEFTLSEDGLKVNVNYTWPSDIYHPEELFENELKSQAISLNDPKIHALRDHLLQLGITENSKPRGQITITLPIRVQREVNTWSWKGIKKGDTKMVILEFRGYQANLIINDVDTTITFE